MARPNRRRNAAPVANMAAQPAPAVELTVFTENGEYTGEQINSMLGLNLAEQLAMNEVKDAFTQIYMKFGATAIRYDNNIITLSVDGTDSISLEEPLLTQVIDTIRSGEVMGDDLNGMNTIDGANDTTNRKLRAAAGIFNALQRLDWLDIDDTLVSLYAIGHLVPSEETTKQVRFMPDAGLLIRVVVPREQGLNVVKIVTDAQTGETVVLGEQDTDMPAIEDMGVMPEDMHMEDMPA